MIQKQTVYLPVKQSQTTKTVICDNGDAIPVKQRNGYFFTPDQFNEYTANVIRESLETAAEKALCDFDEGGCTEFVDEKSITNTFEETFKKFEV